LSVRLIASSSRDLRGLVSAGRFRQELYRRIATLEITVPPLRERMEDLPMLAESFVSQFAQMYGKRVERIAQDAMERLMAHRWPGNVLELENILRIGVLLSDGVELLAEELPEFVVVEGNAGADAAGVTRLEDVVERHVLHVLKSCEGNKLRAAETLGISRSTLYRMLESCTLSSR
jgi:DNA-binding NtrC family response regulator